MTTLNSQREAAGFPPCPEESPTPTVFQAISAVMGEMRGIGKDQVNKDQGYKFRGIDDVMRELHPLLSKHGVIFAPDVVERLYEERISKSGNVGHVAHLHINYKIYGPAGDFIEVSTWGEGLDYSDKETNKAMTAAFKYALFQVFAVADPEDDSDHTTNDGGVATGQTQKRHSSPVAVDASEDIQLILDAAEKTADQFLCSLADQYRDRGTLTKNQVTKGAEKARRFMTTPRSAPTTGETPWPDEAPF